MKTIKKGIYTIILFTLTFTISCSTEDDNEITQFTFPENETIFLDTQEKLDAFGALGHTVFTEHIVIGTLNKPNTSITNLKALSTLTSVKGLTIDNNNALSSLTGLNALIAVAITKSANSSEVAVKISNNPNLINLDGLNNLASIGGDLIIEENPNLTNYEGLIGLQSIDGNFFVQMNGIISMNGITANLDGLNNLASIGGDLTIEENPNLDDISGLIGLKTIGGNAFVGMNGIIANLDGLNNITSVGGDIIIEDNPFLTDFCGIRPVMVSDGFTGAYTVNNNAFNPSFSEIIDLSCD